MSPDANAVLVVDDDPQLSRTVCDILTIHGYRSMAARTGSEGIEIAASDPDALPVALVDLRLPDMDGLEVVSRLHEVAALTEVVILTGNASLDSAVAALRENSCDYLIKPVAPDELVATVKRGVQRWQHRSAEEDLRRDRERFKLLVEALSEIITLVSRDGLIQYQSPAALRSLGYGPGALAGTPFLEHVKPEDRHAVREALHAATATPGQERALELRFRTDGGGWCLLEGVARTLHVGPGAPVVVTCRDITERRRLEDELRQSQKLESIGRLAGGIAHDFNNQLTAILGCVDLALWDQVLPAAVESELEEVRLAAQRAARLTRQLLIFSRKDVPDPQRIDAGRAAAGMLSMLRRLVPAHIAIETELAEDLPPVLIDPTQLEQVLLNLVVNARDAMPSSGGTIRIRTRIERGPSGTDPSLAGLEGDAVVLEVQDDGRGMSRETMEKIFEPFFTTKELGRGTGLGLATCYGIVTRAGGVIRAQSEPDEGATFQVLLPARPDAPEPRQEPEAAARERRPREATLLVVEDDEAVRGAVVRILERRGYRVLAAGDGVEAERLLESEAVDLLVTDLVLPGTTGRRLAERATARQPGLRVLFTSGYADVEALGDGPPAPGTQLLPKPIEADALLDHVERALDAPA